MPISSGQLLPTDAPHVACHRLRQRMSRRRMKIVAAT
jgi:hypothetical protein